MVRELGFAVRCCVAAVWITVLAGDWAFASQPTNDPAPRKGLQAAYEAAVSAERAGDLAGAEAILREALARLQVGNGEVNGADLAGVLGRIARLRSMQGDKEEFGELLERAVAEGEKELGPVSGRLSKLQIMLADRLQQEGRIDEAAALYGRAIRGFDELDDRGATEELFLAHALDGLAAIHLEQQRFDRAIPLIQRHIAIYQTLGGKGGNIGWSAWQLGDAFIQLDRLEQAEESLKLSVANDGPEIATRQLAAIRTLGPYVDASPADPQALGEFRKRLKAEIPVRVLYEGASMLQRRAAHLYTEDPDGRSWRAICEAYAEIQVALLSMSDNRSVSDEESRKFSHQRETQSCERDARRDGGG